MVDVRKSRYSIVIPVYRNESSIPRLMGAISLIRDSLDHSLEIVLVVDGSPDNSLTLLLDLAPELGCGVQIVELSRNFGAFSAIRAGLDQAEGDYIAVLSADLQEPVDLATLFFRSLQHDNLDVVIGQRVAREDGFRQRVAASVYWGIYRRFVNTEIPQGGADVFACTRAVARVLASFTEVHTSLIGLLFWSGFRRGTIRYQREVRLEGKSTWTLRKRTQYFSDSVFAFTSLPLTLLRIFGLVGVTASVIVALAVLVAYLTGRLVIVGYAPLILTITGSTSLILLALGIVGSYVWRTYENSKARPYAIVRSVSEVSPRNEEERS